MCILKTLAKEFALSSLLFLSITPVAISAQPFQFGFNTTSLLEEFKQEGKPVKPNAEESKSNSLFAFYQSVSSQVEFLNGTWEGTYVCGQGLTNLKLVIKAKSTTEIDAVFLFSPHPNHPNVPSGSFRMKGNLEVFDSADIPDFLNLKTTSWINRPSGYETVDLRGDVSKSNRRITGNVITSGCSTFDVVKGER
ncbi:MAG TPA: hypothetical protein V6D12_03215 [Candidatus Obscuribacterales bacterium]